MSTPVRLLPAGGNTATLNSYVGLARELAINTDNWSVYVFDGVHPGGQIVGGMAALNQGADVLISSPVDRNLLIYNGAASKWENGTISSADISDWATQLNNYVTNDSLTSTLAGYLTTAAASSTYVSAASPTFTGTATAANLTITGTLTVSGGTSIPGYLPLSGGTMAGDVSMGSSTLYATTIASATGAAINVPNVTSSGTITAQALTLNGFITQSAASGASENTFQAGVQVRGAVATNANAQFVGLGSTTGWGYGIKFSSESSTADASTYFLGTNTGGPNSILALFSVTDAGPIGRSMLQFARSATSGVAWAGLTIGNTVDNPLVSIDGQLNINDNSNAASLLGLAPSWGAAAPSNLDGCQWMVLTGSTAMMNSGLTYNGTDTRMLTICRGQNNHPTIRTAGLTLDIAAGQVNVTTSAFTAAAQIVAGSNAVDFGGGPLMQVISNNSGSNTDLIVARMIPGTANASGPGVGASMQLYSGTSVTTQTSGTMLQNSGGQTELWQFNGSSWGQMLNFNSNRGLTLQAPVSGGHVLFCGASGNPLQINSGSSAGGSGNLALKINNFSPGATIMTLDGAGNLAISGNLQITGTGSALYFSQAGTAMKDSGTSTLTVGTGYTNIALVPPVSMPQGSTTNGALIGGAKILPDTGASSYTLVASDKGGMRLFSTAGATCVVPAGVFNAGDYLYIYSQVGSSGGGSGNFLNVAPGSGMTLRWPSGSIVFADGAHKLNSFGMAMLLFYSSNTAFVLPFSAQGTCTV